MPSIFTRKALSEILAKEGLSEEQRTEEIFSLYGRALDDGYMAKTAAQQAQAQAIENAKADWEKNLKTPDPKESDAYKELSSQFTEYKAMQEARASDAYKGVKGKFFETVYGMVDRKDGAKPVEDQLKEIKEKYEEYFSTEDAGGNGGTKKTPVFSQRDGRTGTNPSSKEDEMYQQLSKQWG